MDSWTDIIGNYEELSKPKAQKQIAECVYKTALKRRAQLLEKARAENPDFVDPFENNLTLEQEAKIEAFKGNKDDKPIPKYLAVEKVRVKYTDDSGKEKTKVTDETKEVSKPKSKWITINIAAKYVLQFIVERYVTEMMNFYLENGSTMSDDSVVLEKFNEYGLTVVDKNVMISPFIIAATEAVRANKIVDATYGELDTALESAIIDQFKNREGVAPSRQVSVLISRLVEFIKLIGIYIGSGLWDQYKKTVDDSTIFRAIRMLEPVVYDTAELMPKFYSTVLEFIEYRKTVVAERKERAKEKAKANPKPKPGKPKAGTVPDVWNEGAGDDIDLDAELDRQLDDEGFPELDEL